MVRFGLVLLAYVSACSAALEDVERPAPAASSPVSTAPAEDPLVLYPTTGGMGHQALLSGRLLLEGGCLYVERTNGERLIPVFRSPNARWNAETLTVETVHGGSFRVGEVVWLSGGTAASLRWSKPPPPGCTGDLYWLVNDVLVRRPGAS